MTDDGCTQSCCAIAEIVMVSEPVTEMKFVFRPLRVNFLNSTFMVRFPNRQRDSGHYKMSGAPRGLRIPRWFPSAGGVHFQPETRGTHRSQMAFRIAKDG